MYQIDFASGGLTLAASLALSAATGPNFYMVTDPTGQFLFIADNGGAKVYSVRTDTVAKTLTQTNSLSVGTAPYGLAVHPSLPLLYIGDTSASLGYYLGFNPANGAPVGNRHGNDGGFELARSPDGLA